MPPYSAHFRFFLFYSLASSYSYYPPIKNLSVSWNEHGIGDAKFKLPSFNLKWCANGGLALHPSIVGIGEAGKEAILPLENPRTMRTISDDDKEMLKQFYSTLSKKFHPDVNPGEDTSKQMQLLNQLKKEWGLWM